eukprot:scaffold12847_cov186-Isochrysis_galbana.AAC.1
MSATLSRDATKLTSIVLSATSSRILSSRRYRQDMREEVPVFDVIIVITRAAAIQVTLARKSPPAQMQATLQEDIPDFLLKHREVEIPAGYSEWESPGCAPVAHACKRGSPTVDPMAPVHSTSKEARYSHISMR